MCTCRGVGPVHIYNPETTLIQNLLGQSFGHSPYEGIPYLCDCGASYVSSAFSSGLIALLCILIALLMGVAGFSRKQALILFLVWASLIGFNFLQHFERVTGAGSPGPIIEEYLGKFVASIPIQLAVDALLLLIVPAGLAFAVRALMLRSAGSDPVR